MAMLELQVGLPDSLKKKFDKSSYTCRLLGGSLCQLLVHGHQNKIIEFLGEFLI